MTYYKSKDNASAAHIITNCDRVSVLQFAIGEFGDGYFKPWQLLLQSQLSLSEFICPSRVPNYRFKQSSPFRQFPARIYHASKNSPSSFTYQEFTCPTVNCARPVYFYTLAKKASESSTSVKQKGVGSYPLPHKVSHFALSSSSLAPWGGKMRDPGNEVVHGAGGAICSKNGKIVPYHRCG